MRSKNSFLISWCSIMLAAICTIIIQKSGGASSLPSNSNMDILQSGIQEKLFASGTWEEVYVPISSTLLSADFISPDDGWSVGLMGEILRWDGKIWSRYPSPVNMTLNDIELLSPDEGWAVGAGGTILHWNGESWDNWPSPTYNQLFDVTFLSSDIGWAVGGEFLEVDPGDPSTLKANRIILKWDGNQWREVPTPPRDPINWELKSIVMLSEEEGWAAGIGGILRWDGASWQEHALKFDYGFQSIDAIHPKNIWMVGYDLPALHGVILHWDGVEWTKFGQSEYELNSIDMVDSSFGWAVGGNNLTKEGGSVILNWNGLTWSEFPSPTELPVQFVWAQTHYDAWILAGGNNPNVGYEGAVYRYSAKPAISQTEPASLILATSTIKTEPLSVSTSTQQSQSSRTPASTSMVMSNKDVRFTSEPLVWSFIGIFVIVIVIIGFYFWLKRE